MGPRIRHAIRLLLTASTAPSSRESFPQIDRSDMLVWTSLIAREKRRSLLSLSGTVLGALFVVHLANFYGWTFPWLVAGILVALFVIRAIGGTVWFLARHPFATCDLGLSEATMPGGAIRSAIRMESRRPVEIRDLRITLRAEQRDAAGVNRELLSLTRELLSGKVLPAGGRLEVTAELEVPKEAPFSYRSFEGRIRWLVQARLEATGFGVAEEEIEVLVAPAS